MYYGWDVPTIYGVAPRYTDESNIPATTLPGTFQSIENPSLDLRTTKSAVLLFPIVNSIGLLKSPAGEIYASSFPVGRISPSVFVMNPVNEVDLPAGARIELVMIGAVPVWVAIIVIAILVTGATLILAGPAMIRAWADVEYEKAQQAYYDTLARAMEVVSETYLDVDGDGIDDIKQITYANGKVVALALTDAGLAELGAPSKVVVEGTGFDAPEPPPIDWTTIVIYLVVGAAVIALVLGLTSKGGSGITVLR